MVRRASGGVLIRVPGVYRAVRADLAAFAEQWDSDQARRDVDLLDRFELAVDGETIWRATFDHLYPHEGDRWLGDEGLYRITGPDTVEASRERA